MKKIIAIIALGLFGWVSVGYAQTTDTSTTIQSTEDASNTLEDELTNATTTAEVEAAILKAQEAGLSSDAIASIATTVAAVNPVVRSVSVTSVLAGTSSDTSGGGTTTTDTTGGDTSGDSSGDSSTPVRSPSPSTLVGGSTTGSGGGSIPTGGTDAGDTGSTYNN